MCETMCCFVWYMYVQPGMMKLAHYGKTARIALDKVTATVQLKLAITMYDEIIWWENVLYCT